MTAHTGHLLATRPCLLFVAIALAATACADPATPDLPAEASANAIESTPPGLDIAAVHIMRTRADVESGAQGSSQGKGGGGGVVDPGTGILYHGGPVLQSQTKVVAIYWASAPIYTNGPTPGTTGPGSGDGSLIGYFLSHLGGSDYFDINTTYWDDAGQPIASIVDNVSYCANDVAVPAEGQTVSNSEVLSMLESGFASGAITYDAATLYLIFTPGLVNPGGGFGTRYCAYHGWGTVRVGKKKFTALLAALPYAFAHPNCSAGTNVVDGVEVPWSPANGDWGADAEVNLLAHEIVETTTDPLHSAWYDELGKENADKCGWRFGGNYGKTYFTGGRGIANMVIGTKHFLVQANWVNAKDGGCTLGLSQEPFYHP